MSINFSDTGFWTLNVESGGLSGEAVIHQKGDWSSSSYGGDSQKM